MTFKILQIMYLVQVCLVLFVSVKIVFISSKVTAWSHVYRSRGA
jgi:hypothetical protein